MPKHGQCSARSDAPTADTDSTSTSMSTTSTFPHPQMSGTDDSVAAAASAESNSAPAQPGSSGNRTWDDVMTDLAQRRSRSALHFESESKAGGGATESEFRSNAPGSTAAITLASRRSNTDEARRREDLRRLHEDEETYYTVSRKSGLSPSQAIEFAITVGAFDAEAPYLRLTAFMGSSFVPVSVAKKYYRQARDEIRGQAEQAGVEIPPDSEIYGRLQYLGDEDQAQFKRCEGYSEVFRTGVYTPS
ncbi:hypothetical protein I316_04656 [Kwoniella heveanensis BCC8398]|uniref:Uncharacterized protein n=1 Tax=Kwoniella heveanensis BCC8398 TaxID=1296120 RepID=A0A1B9GRD8_9TREE|nr:hypothetical protein I316_04656 [Kwoniella heveanensis BCC8398]